MWVPFTRSSGPPWTSSTVAAMIGEVREVTLPWGVVRWRILDGRMTRDARRAEFLIEPLA